LSNRSEVDSSRHAVAEPAPPLNDVLAGSHAMSPAAATTGSDEPPPLEVTGAVAADVADAWPAWFLAVTRTWLGDPA
jgi:hypothetical protein